MAPSLFNVNSGISKGNWELDLKSDKLYWSDSQYKIYGYKPNELSLNDEYFLLKTTHPSDIERTKQIISEALKGQEGYTFRRRIIKKNDNLGFVETHAKIIRSYNGELNKIVGITIDVEGQLINGNYDYRDPVFFNQLYKNYVKAINLEIFNFVYDKDVAKDLSQEIFIKVWNKIASYDPEKGKLYTWLINITRNHCRDYLRSRHSKFHEITSRLDLSHDKVKSDTFTVDKLHIKELLLQLSPERKEIIELLFLKGYTQLEVARMKTLPLGTVKTKSSSAIKILRKISEENSNSYQDTNSFNLVDQ